MTADVVNLFVERRVMWNDLGECQATSPGGWDLGPGLKGSFVPHICDRAIGHDGAHFNSQAGISWPADRRTEVMA